MFRIENDRVFYKSEEMIAEIHFGNTKIVEQSGENEYCVKKFILSNDRETGVYEVDKSLDTYIFNGKEYALTDGYFTVEEEGKEIIEYSPSDGELMLMEVQAETYEEQQSNNLTIMETMAEIYETILGGE